MKEDVNTLEIKTLKYICIESYLECDIYGNKTRPKDNIFEYSGLYFSARKVLGFSS